MKKLFLCIAINVFFNTIQCMHNRFLAKPTDLIDIERVYSDGVMKTPIRCLENSTLDNDTIFTLRDKSSSILNHKPLIRNIFSVTLKGLKGEREKNKTLVMPKKTIEQSVTLSLLLKNINSNRVKNSSYNTIDLTRIDKVFFKDDILSAFKIASHVSNNLPITELIKNKGFYECIKIIDLINYLDIKTENNNVIDTVCDVLKNKKIDIEDIEKCKALNITQEILSKIGWVAGSFNNTLNNQLLYQSEYFNLASKISLDLAVSKDASKIGVIGLSKDQKDNVIVSFEKNNNDYKYTIIDPYEGKIIFNYDPNVCINQRDKLIYKEEGSHIAYTNPLCRYFCHDAKRPFSYEEHLINTIKIRCFSNTGCFNVSNNKSLCAMQEKQKECNIILYDIEKNKTLKVIWYTKPLAQLIFTPDDNWIMAVPEYGPIDLINIFTKKIIPTTLTPFYQKTTLPSSSLISLHKNNNHEVLLYGLFQSKEDPKKCQLKVYSIKTNAHSKDFFLGLYMQQNGIIAYDPNNPDPKIKNHILLKSIWDNASKELKQRFQKIEPERYWASAYDFLFNFGY